MHAGQVEIALNVWDQGVQTASASTEMAQRLLPAGYTSDHSRSRTFAQSRLFAKAVLTGCLPIGDRIKDEETTPDPETEPTSKVEIDVVQLLPECEGHQKGERWPEAWGCYAEILERDSGNEAAQWSQGEIERGYRRERMRAAGLVSAPPEVLREREVCPRLVVIPPGSCEMGSPASEAGRDDAEGLGASGGAFCSSLAALSTPHTRRPRSHGPAAPATTIHRTRNRGARLQPAGLAAAKRTAGTCSPTPARHPAQVTPSPSSRTAPSASSSSACAGTPATVVAFTWRHLLSPQSAATSETDRHPLEKRAAASTRLTDGPLRTARCASCP